MRNIEQKARTRVASCLSALAAASLTGIAAAQPSVTPEQGGKGNAGGAGVRLEDLPPSIRLGARVSAVRARLPVIPTVVLVPDRASYLAAVGSWSTRGRFPVLIDDGSWAAGEAIARFVRAFKPERVVRFATESKPENGEAGLRGAVERAVASAWDCDDPAKLHDRWRELNFVPPGVVVAHPTDPAWTGALALAAGHGQPIVWLNARPWGAELGQWIPYDAIKEFMASLETELKQLPWGWEALGDELDSVTVCQSAPVKFATGDANQNNSYALMDVIGRHPGVLELAPRDPARARHWAWAGQVIGNEWQAAYAAMCSLYLSPERVWLFDGYDDSAPWNNWDATAAAEHFQKAGLLTLLDDGTRRGLEDWRRRAAGAPRGGDPGVPARGGTPAGLLEVPRGVNASFVLVNSSGNADFFDLKPGQGKPDDIPFLHVPSAVHFVHSWSATNPGDRDTVAGRWIERGAFAYLGSTYEPYLQAFVPTPVVAQRLLIGIPFGAAVRPDSAEPWKLTVIGDPLYVAARPVARSQSPLPAVITGTPIAEALPEQLKAGEFAAAVGTLRLSGRDSEAARLLAAIIKDQPAALTAEVALRGLVAAFFELEPAVFAQVYAAAMPRIAADPALAACKDLIWHATYGRGPNITELEADLLSQSMRPGCLARDAAEAARAAQRTRGIDAARAVIDRARSMARDDATRAEIDRWAP